MLGLVSFQDRYIDLSALEGPSALRWYLRRVYHFKPLGEKIRVGMGHSMAFRWQPPTQISATARRPLPTAFTKPREVQLILERALAPRASQMSSEVWLARVEVPGDAGFEDLPRVVVKFLQPSQMMQEAHANEIIEAGPSDHWDHYTFPDAIARREAASYDRLHQLQGDVIPYFFGKDIVSTQHLYWLSLLLPTVDSITSL